MKKCPECGNPSYDGAPVCGNCGYKFPKPKVSAPKEESIFDKTQKPKKPSEPSESTISILKEKKLIIGVILLITIIVICGIVLTGSNNNNNSSTSSSDLIKVSEGEFSFKHPGNWEELNISDPDHTNAKFFKNGENTIIEYYNSTMDSTSLKEITQDRITYAQTNDSSVELVETIKLDGRNVSNIILENADGNYTRFVSMFSDGKLYVFKISGESMNAVTSDDVNAMINTADIA